MNPSRVSQRSSYPSPDRPSELVVSLLIAVLAFGWILGCRRPSRDRVEQVAAWSPATMGEVEPQIRRQFVQAIDRLRKELAANVSDAQLASAVGEVALLHHVYQNHEEAIEAYGAAEELDPSEDRWPYYRALLHQKEGDASAAREAFETALDADPENFSARIRLAEAYVELGELDRAAELYEALDDRLAPARILAGRAELASKQGNHPLAVDLFTLARDIRPENQRIRLGLAGALRAGGRLDEAKGVLTEVSSSNPRDFEIDLEDPLVTELSRRNVSSQQLWASGRALLAAGRAEEAEQRMRQALEIVPENVAVRTDLGTVLAVEGKAEGADELYRQVLAAQPDYLPALAQRARLQAVLGKRAEAIRIYKHALEVDATQASLHKDLGDLYRLEGSYPEAIESYGYAIKLDPTGQPAYVWRAWSQHLEGDTRSALDTLRTGLSQIPRDPWLKSLEMRIRASHLSSDQVTAVALEARKLFAGNPSAFNAETVAMLRSRQGNHRAAADWQRAALEAAHAAGIPTTLMESRLEDYEAGRMPRQILVPGDIDASRVAVSGVDLEAN